MAGVDGSAGSGLDEGPGLRATMIVAMPGLAEGPP